MFRVQLSCVFPSLLVRVILLFPPKNLRAVYDPLTHMHGDVCSGISTKVQWTLRSCTLCCLVIRAGKVTLTLSLSLFWASVPEMSAIYLRSPSLTLPPPSVLKNGVVWFLFLSLEHHFEHFSDISLSAATKPLTTLWLTPSQWWVTLWCFLFSSSLSLGSIIFAGLTPNEGSVSPFTENKCQGIKRALLYTIARRYASLPYGGLWRAMSAWQEEYR